MIRSGIIQIVALGFCLAVADKSLGQWKQWGGPKQNFKVKCKGLAGEWPKDGPPKLWSRDLGEGYSGILADKGRLYTMYRDGGKEVVVAMKAKSGEPVWEHRYDSPVHEKHEKRFNSGPRATPLISGKRLYTIGCSGKMFCLNAKSGKVYWKKDLWKDYEGSFLNHGYSSSPFVYKDSVIALVGGEGHSIVAFDKESGEELWKKQNFGNSYSTPKLINVDGQDQLLCFMAQELVAINPKNGKLLWDYQIGNRWNQNISQPIWRNKDKILFISVAQAGSRGLKLTRKGKKTKVEEVWTNKVGVHHSNAIRIGEYVYTSTGGFQPGLFQAINIKTGEIAWRERGFAKATMLYADGQFIILDENGQLGLATATPELFEVHATAPILEPIGGSKTWTVPTLVDTTLYLRDSSKIMALDLGVSPKAS